MIKKYRLMYFFGVWNTSATIYAETDAEAIHDAKELPMKAKGQLPYALFCGNRRVIEF